MRKEKINGISVKVFTKKDLMDKLGFSEDEAKVVMKYQKTFPELLQDDVEGFVIDARKLWEQLGEPQGRFDKWISRKVTKFYEESEDFSKRDSFVLVSGSNLKRPQSHYSLTIDCAKNVCMSENTDVGRLTRKYFILIEKALRNIADWIVVREPQKEGYKDLCRELKKRYAKDFGGQVPNMVYSNEADMLNVGLLGARAKQIRDNLEISDNKTREWLTLEVNKALSELQMFDRNLIIGGVDFKTRKSLVQKTCDSQYKDLKMKVFDELNIQ